jgi:hypothetical protein
MNSLIKVHTTLSLSKDILDYCKENKIVLSHWVEKEFSDKFLNIESKQKELEGIEKRAEEIKKEIALINARVNVLRESITDNEKRYLCTVNLRAKEGYLIPSMLTFFNREFKRNFTLPEFKNLAEIYEKKTDQIIKNVLLKGKR